MLEFNKGGKMHLKIFTLEFNPAEGVFHDSVVMDFLKDKSLISVKDYLVEKNGKTFLTVIVTYSLKEIDRSVVTKSGEPNPKATAWKELLTTNS